MRKRLLILLTAGFGTLVLLMALVGFGVMRRVRQMNEEIESAQRSYLAADAVLRDIPADLHLAGILVRDYLLDPSPEAASDYKAQLIHYQEAIEKRLGALSSLPLGDEAQAVQKLRNEAQAYLDSLDPMLAWSPEEKVALSFWFVQRDVMPRRNTVIKLSRELAGLNLKQLESARENARRNHDGLLTFLGNTLGIALALALVVAALTISLVVALERKSQAERARAEAAEQEQRRLARKLVRTQEQERKFLSLELHDAIGQMLSAAGMELGNLEKVRQGPGELFRERLEEIRRLNTDAVRAVKDLAAGLRPATLDELGLGPALRAHAREFSRRCNVPVDVQIDGDVDSLPEEHRTSVFRVVQEALNNCARHAKAKSIRISAYGRKDWMSLTIQDDGVGFNPFAPRKGLGLMGIEERVRDLGGKVTVSSHPGKGTTLEVEVPVNPAVAA